MLFYICELIIFRMDINVTAYHDGQNNSAESFARTFQNADESESARLFNFTQQSGITEYHPITTIIEQYLIPAICIFGITGNTLASAVFLEKTLRNRSCSIFLAARGFSDNGFLLTLLIIWISRTFQLQLGSINCSCQIIIFLSYVCGCISVWLVVFVTFENYIRICRPFIVNRICTTSFAKVTVGIVCFVAVCFYNFPFWAMTPDTCMPYLQFYNAVQAFVYTDTVLTLVLPLICISTLMTAIVYDLVKSYNRRNRLRAPTAKKVKNPMAKVTKMLLAVTVSFICLNLPSHVNRIRIMISSFVSDESHNNRSFALEEAVQQITLLVYYLSLSTNIIVYIIFGGRFRKVLRNILSIFPHWKMATERSTTEITPLNTNTFEMKTESVMKYSFTNEN